MNPAKEATNQPETSAPVPAKEACRATVIGTLPSRDLPKSYARRQLRTR
jgi:hypothetical protein